MTGNPLESWGLGGRRSPKNRSQETKEEGKTDQLSQAERLSSDMGCGRGTGVQEWRRLTNGVTSGELSGSRESGQRRRAEGEGTAGAVTRVGAGDTVLSTGSRKLARRGACRVPCWL